MDMRTVKVGDEVYSRHGKAKIIRMEITENKFEKYGIEANEVFTKSLDYVIMVLDNGHWAYGGEVELVNERVS
jgi:hypothetical protein